MNTTVSRNGIYYSGVSQFTKVNNSNFKVFTISKTIKVNCEKEVCIESIIGAKCEVNISNYKFVKTPFGKSLEGQILTGNKIFFKANMKCSIQYLTNKENNQLCYYKTTFHFLESMNLDKYLNTKSNSLNMDPIITDITTLKIGPKEIYLTVLINVDLNF
ncbi:MAG: hypothetical protein ACRC68_12385 [Clostridium sp.]